MDIGVLVTATARSGDLVEVARQVEALGFDSLWIPEHPVIPVNMKTPFPGARDGRLPDHYNRWSDPFIALTVAATVTKRIKLATGICLLPERDPLVTAKVVASLDLYSGGRVILGVGAGWLREETEVMGTNFGWRWKRLRETVEAMRVLWTQTEAHPGYAQELGKTKRLVQQEPAITYAEYRRKKGERGHACGRVALDEPGKGNKAKGGRDQPQIEERSNCPA